MCVVSMIGDHYKELIPKRFPDFFPNYPNYDPNNPPSIIVNQSEVTRAEFEELKKMVLEMKELLKKAKIYDEKNNEPNCEMEDKVALLKKVAELVGVDLKEIFKS